MVAKLYKRAQQEPCPNGQHSSIFSGESTAEDLELLTGVGVGCVPRLRGEVLPPALILAPRTSPRNAARASTNGKPGRALTGSTMTKVKFVLLSGFREVTLVDCIDSECRWVG